eukprot:7985102-Pyramimonas_sp.AAC.1
MPTITKKQKTVSNVLQSRDEYGMLVETQPGQLLSVVGRPATWLQCLGRTTAECLHQSHRGRSGRTSFSGTFESKTRMSTLDGAGANEKYETDLLRDCLLYTSDAADDTPC